MNVKIILIIIALANPNEKEAFEYFTKQVGIQYELVGAKRVTYPVEHVLLGEEQADYITVVEFPNPEALHKLFSSEDYKKLLPYREKAFKSLKVFLSKRE